MFFGRFSYAFSYLADAIALPRPKGRPAARPISGNAPSGYGCCPACHDFIRADPFGPSRVSVCPSCGRRIRSLDPLGSDKSLGATDEL